MSHPRHSWGWFLSLCKDAVSIFYCPSQLGCMDLGIMTRNKRRNTTQRSITGTSPPDTVCQAQDCTPTHPAFLFFFFFKRVGLISLQGNKLVILNLAKRLWKLDWRGKNMSVFFDKNFNKTAHSKISGDNNLWQKQKNPMKELLELFKRETLIFHRHESFTKIMYTWYTILNY